MVRIGRQPGALTRWWDTWVGRRGIVGPRLPGRERPRDELLAPVGPSLVEAGSCEGRPHVLTAAAAPLSWDVIDELDRYVCAGRDAHLELTVPRSPVSRDPVLHVLWERRMALDVADREREVAQLWPRTPLVRIEVVRTHPTADRGRWARRLAGRTR